MAEQQNNLLWENCRTGSLEEVRKALQAGADSNTTGGPFHSPCLMEAARNNHDEVVALLLSSPGIQVNAKDLDWRTNEDWTALHFACGYGCLASLSKLLAAPGLKLNERNDNGWTPIMTAIGRGKTSAVLQMAAVSEVDLDVKDKEGRSLEEFANR